MADKFHSDTQERIETLAYAAGLQDSGDLEAGTMTVTATAEASGVGNADYSHALALVKPDDARLVVKRIAARLAVTIDSFDTATHLYCRVYVDAQDADHRLFDEDWNSTGEKLDAVDTHSAALATIFDLLKDGAAHTFYFFFWVDQPNNAAISLVELWEGVGSCITNPYGEVLAISHKGVLSLNAVGYRVGTGTMGIVLRDPDAAMAYRSWKKVTGAENIECVVLAIVADDDSIFIEGSVATDLNYLAVIVARLRNEQ